MYKALRDEMAKICFLAWERGHVAAAAGNVSARTPDGAGLLIKVSGIPFAEVSQDDMLFVDNEGRAYECNGMAPARRQPSIEFNLHRMIYESRPDVGAVVHLHSPYTTALSCLPSDELHFSTSEAAFSLGRVPIVPDLEPGSLELASTVAGVFSVQGQRAIALARHGLVACGKNPTEAWRTAEILEHSAKIEVLIRGLGISHH